MLIIDIGNTSGHFAVFNKNRIVFEKRILTSKISERILQKQFADQSFDSIVLSSGVLKVTKIIVKWAKTIGKRCLEMKSTHTFSFLNKTNNPKKLGIDRLVNLEYVAQKKKLPALVIDLGTATTCDFLSREKIFSGGMILPGPQTFLNSTGIRIPKLPRNLIFKKEREVLGRNTEEAMLVGGYQGYQLMLRGIVSLFQEEHPKLTIFVTGGYSDLFSLPGTIKDPLITLKGVLLTAIKNEFV